MESQSQPKRRKRFIVGGLIAFFALFAGLAVAGFGSLSHPAAEIADATESALTTAYGKEVRLAIQAFVNTNWSFAAFRNPQLLENVATGRNLKTLQASKLGWSGKTVDVIRASTLNQVQVIEYSPARLKAFSCGVLNLDTVTLDGTYVSSLKPLTTFRVYVLSREDDVWKVAAWADFTNAAEIERDWTEGMYPQWEKDLIGDLPGLIGRYDPCFSS